MYRGASFSKKMFTKWLNISLPLWTWVEKSVCGVAPFRFWARVTESTFYDDNHYAASAVTYWPSTEPSIKKQVHPVEDIGISPWRVDGLNSVHMRRPQEAGGRKTII